MGVALLKGREPLTAGPAGHPPKARAMPPGHVPPQAPHPHRIRPAQGALPPPHHGVTRTGSPTPLYHIRRAPPGSGQGATAPNPWHTGNARRWAPGCKAPRAAHGRCAAPRPSALRGSRLAISPFLHHAGRGSGLTERPPAPRARPRRRQAASSRQRPACPAAPRPPARPSSRPTASAWVIPRRKPATTRPLPCTP